MGIKLTVHGKLKTEDNYWFDSYIYDKNIIDDIVDPSGGNIDKLLTAVPSPFARMHLFDTAFSLGLKNIKSNKETVFDKLISECFDLFELLFNFELHKSAGSQLSIKFWDFESHTSRLLNSSKVEHKQLAEVLRKYYKANEKLQKLNTIYIFLLDHEVFGATSPFTGCFTKPDLKNFSIKKSNGHPYFSQIVPLWKRDSEFLVALYSLFSPHNGELILSSSNVFRYLESAIEFIQPPELRSKLKELKNETSMKFSFKYLTDENKGYIKVCGAQIPTKDINSGTQIDSPLEILSSKLPEYTQNIYPLVLREGRDYLNVSAANIRIPANQGDIKEISKRVIPNTNIRHPFLVVDDFLENNLVKLNYPVNYDSFMIPEFEGLIKEKDQGFLLPIKKEYFDFFNVDDLKNSCSIHKKSEGGFSVELKVPIKTGEPVIFKKFYYPDPKAKDAGRVINANIYLSFFPLFKVNDEKYNNYYKVMLVDDEVTSKNEVLLVFFDNNFKEIVENDNAKIKISKRVRSKKGDRSTNTSRTYYEVNMPYPAISVRIPVGSSYVDGMIVPLWKDIKIGNAKFDVAVDFGTTNSFVAIREQESRPEALKFGERDLQNVLFNLPNPDSRLSMTERFHDFESTINDRLINKIEHEFIPSIIGEGSNPLFNFPFRTVVSEALDYNEINSLVLGNINIAFIYEKDIKRYDEKITTNLKWAIEDDKNKKRIEEFLRELLIIVRNKLILNHGDPASTRIIWFKPLSMDNYSQTEYENIWNRIFKEVFKIQSTEQIISLTESAAPYYYFNNQDKAYGELPILSIDIGGGSTDISFFLNNVPIFGTSFNFAGNALWTPSQKIQGNSSNFYRFYDNYLDNKIKQFDSANRTEEIQKLKAIYNSHSTEKGVFYDDLIELLFSWEKKINLVDQLKSDSNIKFLILFHFSSLLYHSVQLLKNEKLDIPEFICLSGRGSKYIKVIDPSSDNRIINEYVTNFIGDMYNINKRTIKIVTEENSKEVTCLGGLYMLAAYSQDIKNHDTVISKVYYGESNAQWSNVGEKLMYKDINDELKTAVSKNVSNFIDLFFRQNNNLSFTKNFGIQLKLSYNELAYVMKQDLYKYLNLGLDKRLRRIRDKENEEISETLFFYPLTQLITDLESRLYLLD